MSDYCPVCEGMGFATASENHYRPEWPCRYVIGLKTGNAYWQCVGCNGTGNTEVYLARVLPGSPTDEEAHSQTMPGVQGKGPQLGNLLRPTGFIQKTRALLLRRVRRYRQIHRLHRPNPCTVTCPNQRNAVTLQRNTCYTFPGISIRTFT